jgi:hypothetical protein
MRAAMERKKLKMSRIKRRKKRHPKSQRQPRINVCSWKCKSVPKRRL